MLVYIILCNKSSPIFQISGFIVLIVLYFLPATKNVTTSSIFSSIVKFGSFFAISKIYARISERASSCVSRNLRSRVSITSRAKLRTVFAALMNSRCREVFLAKNLVKECGSTVVRFACTASKHFSNACRISSKFSCVNLESLPHIALKRYSNFVKYLLGWRAGRDKATAPMIAPPSTILGPQSSSLFSNWNISKTLRKKNYI